MEPKKEVSRKGPDEFDDLVKKLQDQIDKEERERFSGQVIEEYHDPKNWGRMEGPDGKGVFCGGCGDTMEFFIKVSDQKIKMASFWTDGCGPTVACGSRLTTLVKGISIDDARNLAPEDLADSLGGLPKENFHCSELTMNALKIAIDDALDEKSGANLRSE